MNRKGTAIWLSMIFIFIFIVILIGLSPKASAYTPHALIKIDGDWDFANQAASEGWPGNGTEDDPYIIEGYEIEYITRTRFADSAIKIQSTNVHFTIRNSRILSDFGNLIFFDNVKNGTIEHCIIENGSGTIMIWCGSQNEFKNNTLINSNIYLQSSVDCTFSNNSYINGGFHLEGSFPEGWNTHSIDTSNTINGKPVYYWVNRDGGTIPENAGQVILVNCTNILIENQNLYNLFSSIILGYSSHITVNENRIHNCTDAGVSLWHSSENTISNNEIFSCKQGIYFVHSDNNTIEYNKLYLNSDGIQLIHSNSNYVFGNNASSNGGYGIYCGSSSGHFMTIGNSVINNTIINNRLWGIKIEFLSGIVVIGNNISNNHIGIHLSSANEGIFHHNTLINNSIQLEREDSENVWQDGKSQGNYWSDYEGLDANGDGIGDTSLPHLFVDYHPLMEPGGPGDYGEPDSEGEPSPGSDDCFSFLIVGLIVLVVIILILLLKKRKEKSKDDEDKKSENSDKNAD